MVWINSPNLDLIDFTEEILSEGVHSIEEVIMVRKLSMAELFDIIDKSSHLKLKMPVYLIFTRFAKFSLARFR